MRKKLKQANAKKSQIKEWQRYCDFENQGQKFIFKEVYEEVKEKMDDRKNNKGGNNKSEYIKNIEILLLDLLSQSKQGYGKVFLSKNVLLKELKMINPNYAFCKQRMPKLSKFINIDKTLIEEFFDTTADMLERNLETALKSLESQSLILWTKEITVVEVLQGHYNNITKTKKIDEWDEEIVSYRFNDIAALNHREGTEEEKTYIIHTEREVLKEMKCKNKAEVINMGMWETFINKVNDIILKECNLAFYYKSYKILFNEDHVYEVIEDLCDFELNKDERNNEHIKLNKSICNRIEKNVSKRQDKAQQEADKVTFGITNDSKILRRIAKQYIEDNNILVDTLITINAEDISEKVKRTRMK